MFGEQQGSVPEDVGLDCVRSWKPCRTWASLSMRWKLVEDGALCREMT